MAERKNAERGLVDAWTAELGGPPTAAMLILWPRPGVKPRLARDTGPRAEDWAASIPGTHALPGVLP